MKKNSLKNACNAAMHRNIGHQSVKCESEPKSKLKFALIALVLVLVIGVPVVFALVK
jgi:hypothetical protein